MTADADPSDICNWQRRSDRLTTSGKLESGDPARLASIGVQHVINLALDDHPEALADEGALLARSGIAYTHIPVPFDAPTPTHVAELKDAMKAVPGPVHVHCIMNYRVAAFLYLLDIEDGIPEPEARSSMVEIWDPLKSDDPRLIAWRELLT